jgi:hypothetical protein
MGGQGENSWLTLVQIPQLKKSAAHARRCCPPLNFTRTVEPSMGLTVLASHAPINVTENGIILRLSMIRISWQAKLLTLANGGRKTQT